MKIQEMGILNKLINILNTENMESSDWILARYMLDNIYDLTKVNIIEMSEECFVSRATIRRFAIRLGYENFSNLKSEISNIFQYQNVSYDKNGNLYYESTNCIIEAIYDLIDEIESILYKEKSRNIVDQFIQARKIVFLSSGKLQGFIKHFQEDLIIFGKETYAKLNLEDEKFFEQINEEDLLVVASASGKYYKLIEKDLEKLRTNILLISLTDMNLENSIIINNSNISDIKVDIFNKYGLTFILDMLLNEYRRNI